MNRLNTQWLHRASLRAEAAATLPDVEKITADAAKLQADGKKLKDAAQAAWAAVDILFAHAKLHLTEGNRLVAEGVQASTSADKAGAAGAKQRGDGSALREQGAKELVEGHKLMAEAIALRDLDEGATLWAAGKKLLDDADAITVEVDDLMAGWAKLIVDAYTLWDAAITNEYGKLAVEWRWNDPANAFDSLLANGEEYIAVAEPSP